MPRPSLLLTALAVTLVATPMATAWVLRSPPGFYPGDRGGWRQLGWADSDRFFRYSYNDVVGRWSAGCFGCGIWIPDAAPAGWRACGACEAWDGAKCLSAPSGACAAGIAAGTTCGPCTYWENGGCVAAPGCGIDFCGGGSGGSAATVVTSNGGNTVFYSSPSGGGVATSSGGGSSYIATSGSGGVGAGTPGGTAAFAGPGGAAAWPGK